MKHFLVSLIIFIPIIALSQQTDFYDIVYLKNGNYVKGMIVSLTVEDGLIIMDTKGKSYKFMMSEISKIEKEDFDKNKFLKIDPDKRVDKTAFNNPYYFLTKFSINRSYQDVATYWGVTAAGGVRFGGLGLGLGLAYNSYTKDEDEAYLPLMIDARYTFYYPKVRPYIYMNPGYSFKTKKRDGYMFAAGVGTSFQFTNYLSGIVELGYYWQEYRYNITPTYVIVGNTDFFVVNLGFSLF